MSQAETLSAERPRPRVTVAVIAERDGQFLFVEEHDARRRLVINQPAGHVEFGESIAEAAVRETQEETGWIFKPESLIGVYSWCHPDGTVSYLRFAVTGSVMPGAPDAVLDNDIVRCLWLDRDELLECRDRHRSPLVLRCLDDYLAGERYPLSLLKTSLS